MSNRPLILLVEDNEVNQLLTSSVLEREGFAVDIAGTSVQALEMLRSRVPDLILMDIQLPGLDGYEATRRIKANPALRHIPIIVVTSYALSGDDVKAFAAGCDAYVTKPFVPRELLAKVREYVP